MTTTHSLWLGALTDAGVIKPPAVEDAEWLRGFAAALGAVQRLHDQPTIVRSVMDGDGITVADLRRAGVEPFDLDPIKQAMPRDK